MFNKLQSKWKVNGWNLALILVTFALGGSLCGYLGRKLLFLTGLDKGFIWFLLYIVLITILWPFCVLLISIPFGQFAFFKRYIRKIWKRMSGQSTAERPNLAVFASGAGTNAGNIINFFSGKKTGRVAVVVTNKQNAGVIDVARSHSVPIIVLNADLPLDGAVLIERLRSMKIDLIVLAGFLLKIPPALIQAYPRKIINIHPALLPAYGGKGMYGARVHEAVLQNREQHSGISIHYVDEIYDHGEVIFQATCDVSPSETAVSLGNKVHALEYEHYPATIEKLLQTSKAS